MAILDEIQDAKQKLYATLNKINDNTWNSRQELLTQEVEILDEITAKLDSEVVQRLMKSSTHRGKLDSVIAPLSDASFVKGSSHARLMSASEQIDKLVAIQEQEEVAQVHAAKAILVANNWEYLLPYIEDVRYLQLLSDLEE